MFKSVKKGSTKPALQALAIQIFEICWKDKINIFMQWIPRSQNDIADHLSKLVDTDDWEISPQLFKIIKNKWGPHDVDRFANYKNAKTRRFNSKFWNPRSEAIDAFSQNWCNDNNLLVPPPYQAAKVIRHVIACRAVGTLVVPKWVSAQYWPMLVNRQGEFNKFVTEHIELGSKVVTAGSGNKNIMGTDRFSSNILVLRIDARKCFF